MSLSPHDRALLVRFTTEQIAEKNLNFFEASDEGCVFVNHVQGTRWQRVVRTYGRYLVVFKDELNRPNDYTMSFLAPDGTLVPYDHRALGKNAPDRVSYEWLRDNGAQRFNGKHWQRNMAAAMVKLASDWNASQTA